MKLPASALALSGSHTHTTVILSSWILTNTKFTRDPHNEIAMQQPATAATCFFYRIDPNVAHLRATSRYFESGPISNQREDGYQSQQLTMKQTVRPWTMMMDVDRWLFWLASFPAHSSLVMRLSNRGITSYRMDDELGMNSSLPSRRNAYITTDGRGVFLFLS
ncbi:hypothetical protein BCR42DRAFT_3289 [Absidia repens]|uniref:Uncharacterized protein n=1 Tax=Absidia repens TaxID=90262 RepID=A0A1X2J022_9FUNG|nr:hypothetical protein BCR42DRAFT_3289 [Absidia repens]